MPFNAALVLARLTALDVPPDEEVHLALAIVVDNVASMKVLRDDPLFDPATSPFEIAARLANLRRDGVAFDEIHAKMAAVPSPCERTPAEFLRWTKGLLLAVANMIDQPLT